MRYDGIYSKDLVWIVLGELLGLIFAGYVLLASQKRYPILSILWSNIDPILDTFGENVIFAIPT